MDNNSLNIESNFDKIYTVIDNLTGEPNDELLVLNPNNKEDLKAIIFYSDLIKEPIKGYLKDWIKEYTEFKCSSTRRDICSIRKSPVCCCNCIYFEECRLLVDSPVCSLVDLGDVIDVKECEEI